MYLPSEHASIDRNMIIQVWNSQNWGFLVFSLTPTTILLFVMCWYASKMYIWMHTHTPYLPLIKRKWNYFWDGRTESYISPYSFSFCLIQLIISAFKINPLKLFNLSSKVFMTLDCQMWHPAIFLGLFLPSLLTQHPS